MRDYEAIHIIQNAGLPKDAAYVLVRNFNKMYEAQEPDGCLSMSSVNCLTLAYLGYYSMVRMGQVEINGRPFYHAWAELDGKVIDNSIYGNTHFSPFADILPPVMPQINKAYGETDIQYFPDKFDKDFKEWPAHIIYGVNLAVYLDKAPRRNALWNLALYCLDKAPTADNMKSLRTIAEKYVIGKSDE